jgi:hypothetical protein
MTLIGNAANTVLATQNWLDQPGTILGGAPFISSLPISNMSQNRLSLVARTGGSMGATSALSPWILLDLGADINPVSLIAFPRHGLSDGATWRIRALAAASVAQSSDTLIPGIGPMTITLASPVSIGLNWFAVVRQNANPNSNWMVGQISAATSGSIVLNAVTYGGLGSVAGPWTIYFLSPDDLSGLVKYDSRPTLAQTAASTPVNLGLGTTSVVVATNAYFFNGAPIGIYSLSAPANWVRGSVVSYNALTGKLTVNITSSSGATGTIADPIVTRGDGDISVWPTVTAFGQGLWGNDYGWGGRLLRGTNYAPPAIHYIPLARGDSMPIYARFWLIEMADPLNAAGYIDFGKLILSPAFQPSINISYGWSIEWIDPSVMTRARGGQVYADTRRSFRRLSLTFENQQSVEAFSRLYELDRTQGKTGPILAIVTPNDPANLYRTTIYGSMSQLGGLINSSYDRFTKSLVIEEWV